MALVEAQSGSQAATISTLHTLGSEETTDAYYQLLVDVSVMQAGDVLELLAELKVKTAGTARVVAFASFRDVQAEAAALSIPIPNIYGLTFKLKQVAGTGRTYDWSILRV
jgi:hypothetical protein